MRKWLYLLILIPHLVVAQQPFTRDFWLNGSNTPLKVNAILQDKVGYIWLGTDAGLYKYNGRNFTLLDDSIHNPVTALAAVGNTIYAGYANGALVQVSNNTIYPVTVYNSSPHSIIRDINISGSVIKLCTEEGLYVVMNNMGFLLNTRLGLSDNYTYSISTPSSMLALVGTDKGIDILSLNHDTVAIRIATSANYNTLTDNIVSVIKQGMEKNTFWIGTQEGGVLQMNLSEDGKLSFIKGASSWQWGQVNDIIPMSENSAWAVTQSGYLLKVSLIGDSLVFKPFNIGKKINKILLGNSGNLWCATTEGITLVTSEYLSFITPSPYSLSKLTAMACTNENVLWYALVNRLYKLSLADTQSKATYVCDVTTPVTCIFPGASGGLWIGTFGSGLLFLKDGIAHHVIGIGELDKASILSITGTGDKLWVASLTGVEEAVITDPVHGILSLLKHHNKRSGIGSDYVYQLYTDSKQRVWMATDGAGICMYDGTNYHHWDTTTGLHSKVIYTITEDADATMWIATLDKGVFFLDDNNNWHSANKKNDLQDINISAIASTRTGQVVIVHQKGIDEWFPQSHAFRQFNHRFIPEIDSVSSVLNCLAKDTEGNVYAPCSKGLILFHNQKNNYKIRPVVHIHTVSAFIKSMSGMQSHFSYDENYITIAFDGINFTSAEPLHYRYMLVGYNNDWVYTDDESVTFAQLPPGTYNFKVEVSFNKAFYKSQHDNYVFTIATPFWKERWFYAALILFTITIIYAYIRWREVQLKKMANLQKERMQYEYEHLKSQVNPHFLFNSLNTLTHLIEEDKSSAIDYTSQLSDMYRHMLSYRDKDLILLSEEMEILKGYMYIQKSRFDNALQMEVNIPPHLLRTKKIVPLALQIVVENAIKHNIVSAATPLVIYIAASDEEIIIRNHLQEKISKEKSSGLGLANICKRYALMSKKEVSFGVVKDEFVVKLPLL